MAHQSMSDLIPRVRDCSTPGDLWEVMLDFFHDHGVIRVSYHHYNGLAKDADVGAPFALRTDGFPEPWVCKYLDEKLFLVDPIPQIARIATSPFFWSDAEKLAELNPRQLEYVRSLKSSDVGDGLALQVYGPSMRNGFLGLGFGMTRPTFEENELFVIQSGAQLGHIRYCELFPLHEDADRKPLAPREQEILLWIARGKSNSSIAEILGISRHTVDTQVRRLFDKLDVFDRTSAAIRGIGAGQILPEGVIRADPPADAV